MIFIETYTQMLNEIAFPDDICSLWKNSVAKLENYVLDGKKLLFLDFRIISI